MSTVLTELCETLQKGNAKGVLALIQQGLDEGISAGQLLDEGLLKGMSIVGERFKNNEVFVPEVLIAARALKGGTNMLAPLLAEEGVQAIGTAVIGTVAGDMHDIGKNLVKMMLEGAGFNVIDLDVNVTGEQFVEAVKEHNPQVVALSALLTTTMDQQGAIIQALKDAGLRDSVKVMVGGAPITQEYADSIGADAYAPDAASAAQVAKSFVLN